MAKIPTKSFKGSSYSPAYRNWFAKNPEWTGVLTFKAGSPNEHKYYVIKGWSWKPSRTGGYIFSYHDLLVHLTALGQALYGP